MIEWLVALVNSLSAVIATLWEAIKAVYNSPAAANWAVALATILLALVAVFQDRLRAWIYCPKLNCNIEMNPPDCHKTVMTDNSLVYYFLFKVYNNGETSARNVEVIISDIYKKRDKRL